MKPTGSFTEFKNLLLTFKKKKKDAIMLINERSKNKFIYFTDKTKSTRLDFYKEGIKAEYLNISKKWRSNSILPLPLWHSLSPIWKEEVFLIKFNVGASFQTFKVG